MATLLWFRRLWNRRAELGLGTKVVAGLVVGSAVLGGLGTVVGLLKAFAATGGKGIDPSQKARALGEGISEAMNCSAMGIVVWLPSVIVLTLITRKRTGA